MAPSIKRMPSTLWRLTCVLKGGRGGRDEHTMESDISPGAAGATCKLDDQV